MRRAVLATPLKHAGAECAERGIEQYDIAMRISELALNVLVRIPLIDLIRAAEAHPVDNQVRLQTAISGIQAYNGPGIGRDFQALERDSTADRAKSNSPGVSSSSRQ